MDQSIQRRQNHPLISFPKFRSPAVYKPYKYIDAIKQNPAHIKRSWKKQESRFPGFLKGRRAESDGFEGIVKPKAAAKPWSFPIPNRLKNTFWASPAPVCVLGGIALFSALILGLQNSPVMALSPGADPAMRANLASYAGIAGAISIADEDSEFMPLDLTENFRWESYTVQRGDSVSKIAAARSISMDAIIASNGISNVRRLREGESIRIPNMNGIPYTVKQGDSLSKISVGMGVPLEAILDANDIQNDTISAGQQLFIPGARMRTEDLRLALGELFIYPIRGALSSPYGWRNDPISGARRYHAALDLAAGLGTPVKASLDGKVATVGLNSVYGKYIILSHSNGFQTLYAHLNTTSVTQGSYIYQGGKIGEVGSTGYSTGPHLHFAVYKNGKPVNPLEFLNK
ncbi:M23 family metallopeptidase [Treponema primitia]|uniref:peptidoglycan DD-metalloendopeptidase family protein n=1 Tax=Treponema primitia TaxID=88058 RepID=UPI0039800213